MDPTPRQPNPRHETRKSPENAEIYVKDGWLDGYYKGNALIPQNGEGIWMWVAISTILDDPDFNWDEFAKSKLSPAQIEFLSNAMNAMHARKNINTATNDWIQKNKPQEEMIVVPPERLQELWAFAKRITMNHVLVYLGFENYYIFDDTLPGFLRDSARIKPFFYRENFKPKIEELRVALQAIKSGFEDPEIRELLKKYRGRFVDGKVNSISEKIWREEGWQKKFQSIMIPKIEAALGHSLSEQMWEMIT